MPESLDQEIRILRTSFWSARDPEGRAFVPLADAYRRKGDLDEARALLAEGLARHPEFSGAHLLAARVARDERDLVAARDHLDRLLDLDPRNVVALIERADARAAEGDRDGATHDLRDALRIDPSNDQARRRMEALEAGLGQEPVQVAEPAAEAPAADDLIYTRTMAEIYARQGFVERAVEVYERLQADDPDAPEIAHRLDELRGEPVAAAAEEWESAGPEAAEHTEPVEPEAGEHAESEEPEAVQEAEPEEPEAAKGLVVSDSEHPDADDAPREDLEIQDGSEPEGQAEPDDGTELQASSTRTIAAYFEDLLAWVPGAVPIESLAPGAEGTPVTEPDPASEIDPDSDEGESDPTEGLDNFQRWLESLGS